MEIGNSGQKKDPDVWDPPTPPSNPKKSSCLGGLPAYNLSNNNKW